MALHDMPTDYEWYIELLLTLTLREWDVLELLIQCMNDEEIQTALAIASGTLSGHRQHIYEKLGANSFFKLMRLARDLGILHVDIEKLHAIREVRAPYILNLKAKARLIH